MEFVRVALRLCTQCTHSINHGGHVRSAAVISNHQILLEGLQTLYHLSSQTYGNVDKTPLTK